jgi:hypothetical protein
VVTWRSRLGSRPWWTRCRSGRTRSTGGHPAAGQKAFARIAAVLAPGGRLFVDGREVALR